MVKKNNVKLTINNNSGFDMIYKGQWYDSGRVANGFRWSDIQNNQPLVVLSYERDWALAGCSGYVQYEISGTLITIAFSNPAAGKNKLNVGKGNGRKVWDDKGNHGYNPFVKEVNTTDQILYFNCKCSGGRTNDATVSIFAK